MSWVHVPESAPLESGATYRIVGTIDGPYTPTMTGAVRIAFATKLAAKGLTISRFDHAAPLFGAHDGKQAPWPFIVTFVAPESSQEIAQAGLDPRAVLAIAALVATVALSLRLASSRLEKLVSTTAAGVGGVLEQSVGKLLEPGTVILVVLGIAIVYGAVRMRG